MPQVPHLTETKRKLLDKYLRGEVLQAREVTATIPVRPPGQPVPLSLAQEQIWFRAQAAVGLASFYNESLTVHRNGPLNLAALEQSVAEIIRRHEIWRTTFDSIGDRPVQRIHPASKTTSIPMMDLCNLPKEEREAVASRIAREELQRPFDLEEGPLLRLTVVRLEDFRYRLYLAVHQIILDGVTAYGVFFPELVALYNAYTSEKPSPLPDPPIQYADFACWQRRHFSDEVLSKQSDYWRQQLTGEIPVLNWPNGGLVPAASTYCGKIYPFALPKALNDRAKALSKRHSVTLFATLFATFITLLHCYTGQDDLIVGTVAPAGRDGSEVQHLMGYFLNPVAVRANLRDDPTFLELLVRTMDSIVGALSHDDIPYEEVVKAVVHDPFPGRNPLFKVAASLEPIVPDCGPGWDLTPMDIECGGTRWDLYFVWEDRPQGITGRVQYCTEVFDREIVTKLVGDFERLLGMITLAPHTCMSVLAQFVSASSLEVPIR